MRLVALTLALLLPLTAAAQDISKVNGAIEVGPGQHAGDVHSVNGSVHIGDNAVVQEASTVNGSIELGSHVQATALRTVNGHLALGEDSRISGDVKTTNGGISLDNHADVSGSVTSVNGGIKLDHAHVGNGIEIASGDISIGEGSRVENGIIVDEQHGFSWSNHIPHIVIGPHAVVTGTLDFRREVRLDVSDSAQIGPVKGTTVNTFHGASPSM